MLKRTTNFPIKISKKILSRNIIEGGGKFEDFSSYQIEVFHKTKKQLKKAVDSLKFPPLYSPIVLVDLGSSTGKISFPVLDFIYQNISSDRFYEFMIFCDDLPENDWKYFLKNLGKTHPEIDIDRKPRAFYSFIGNSFYKRILPENYVHLFISNVALHWLSSIPCKLPTQFLTHAELYKDYKDTDIISIQNQWKGQASTDLIQFLNFRADETVDNGEMCFTILSRTENDDGSSGPHFEVISDAFKEMIDFGVIYPEEAEAIYLPIYSRSELEVKEALSTVQGKWKLQGIESHLIEYNFEKDNNNNNLNSLKAATRLAEFFLSITGSSIQSQLIQNEICNEMRAKNILEMLKRFIIYKYVREKIPSVMNILYLSVSVRREMRN